MMIRSKAYNSRQRKFIKASIGKTLVRKMRNFQSSQISTDRNCFVKKSSESIIRAVKEINSVDLPLSVANDGGIQPSIECRRRAIELVLAISNDFFLIPTRIGASREGGIMFIYRLKDNGAFEIEVDNELEYSCVIISEGQVSSSIVSPTLLDLIRHVRRNGIGSSKTTEVRWPAKVAEN